MAEQTSYYYLGYLGVASALSFATFGAAYGSYKSASGAFNSKIQAAPAADRERELFLKNGKDSHEAMDYSINSNRPYQNLNTNQQYSGPNSTQLVVPAFIPVIMSGVLAIYGLIIGVILSNKIATASSYTSQDAHAHFASGLCVGLTCMASGFGIGSIAQNGVKAIAKQARLFAPMVCMLIFTQAIALYGLIIALILQNTPTH